MEQYQLFIDGNWTDADEKLDVLDKYSQEVYAQVAKADKGTVDKAITSAARAFEQEKLSPFERYLILNKASQLIIEQKEQLAMIITSRKTFKTS